MKINILTLFPNMFDGFLNESIIKRAREKDLVEINTINIRDFSDDKHKHVDDTPYGGGAGMVLKCDPIFKAVDSVKTKKSKVILLTPEGSKYNQEMAYDLAKEKDLIFICGHYEGFDDRIKSIVDMEISIGDYVLTGGELPSMVITDSITRLVPGVIEEESHLNDSFNDDLLDYPQYTKPREYNGMKVPDVLLSGDHKKIEEWRKEEQIKKTKEKRPDLLKKKETKRKKIGKYTLVDDDKEKRIFDIRINNTYDFGPKPRMKKQDIVGINKVVLVKPSFVEAVAKKNITKKLNILLKQVSIVLNDETDDEGAEYVFGEIERLEIMLMTNYINYLPIDYINLIKKKLRVLKEEVYTKQMERIETVDYERGRRL